MPRPDWAPELGDVATHLRRFTRDPNGRPLGTFTATTTIPAAEVEGHIDVIVDEIGAVSEHLEDRARVVASLGIASLSVIDKDRDLSQDLWDRYLQMLAGLRAAINLAATGTAPATSPSGSFPPPFGAGRESF